MTMTGHKMATAVHDVDFLIHKLEALLRMLKQVKSTLGAPPDLETTYEIKEVSMFRASIERFIRTIKTTPDSYEPTGGSKLAENVEPEIVFESIDTIADAETPGRSAEFIHSNQMSLEYPPQLEPTLHLDSTPSGFREHQTWHDIPANPDALLRSSEESEDLETTKLESPRSHALTFSMSPSETLWALPYNASVHTHSAQASPVSTTETTGGNPCDNTPQTSLSPSCTEVENQADSLCTLLRGVSADDLYVGTSPQSATRPISLGCTPNHIQTPFQVDLDGKSHLPTALPSLDGRDDIQKIATLIDFATENIPPSWLDCRTRLEFRQRLDQFLPGALLDDIVVRKVLTMLASQCGFSVFDSLLLDITQPLKHIGRIQEALTRYEGLILPLHVNAKSQGSSKGRNHWILAIIDRTSCTFATFGMEQHYYLLWVDELLPAIRGAAKSNQAFDARNEEIGLYEQDSCCGLLCFLAVERHFGFVHMSEAWPVGTELRARYLQRLVQAWIAQSQLCALQGQSPIAVLGDPIHFIHPTLSTSTTPSSTISSTRNSACSNEDHGCARRDLEVYSGGLEGSKLLEALDDESLVLRIGRRARLLQMIAECSIPSATAICETALVMPPISSSFVTPLMKFMVLNSQARVITFQQRLHLVEAATKFDLDIHLLDSERDLERKKRKRSRTSKGLEEPRDTKTELVILRQALISLGCDQDVLKKPKTSIYFKLIEEGRQLRRLAHHMGQNFLTTLPCAAVYRHDARLHFPLANRCFHSLRKNIDPADYHSLDAKEMAFFLKWTLQIRPEFRNLGSVNPESLRPSSGHLRERLPNRSGGEPWLAETSPGVEKKLNDD